MSRMSNEKAIRILKELWRFEKTDKFSEEEVRQALSIAINAIEAVDYDCANCKWYLIANSGDSDYPDLEQDEREREETE